LTSFVLGLSPAAADPLPGQDRESRLLSDRLNVTLGGFQPEFSTDVAAGVGGVLGAFVNVERTLGLDEDLNVFRLSGFYRFKPRHTIDWAYSVLNRDGVALIDEQVEFDGRVFELGAEVASKFDSTFFGLNYKYSFINNGKVDAGVSGGLFTYDYDLALVGEARLVGEGESEATLQQADTRVLAPLPALGIFINYAVRKDLVFRAEVKALNIEVGDFTGKFNDSLFTLDWYFYKHVGIGIGGSRTSIDFRAEGDDPFRVDYEYGGFVFHVSIVF
jgi:hypothetical protein